MSLQPSNTSIKEVQLHEDTDGGVVAVIPVPPKVTLPYTPRAPAGGNMFTRFMKTSSGADVCAPLPPSIESHRRHEDDPFTPYRQGRAEPRRQIGILCNSMTTLDMVELAHHIIPSISLGSPRLDEQAPPLPGDRKYDYSKHLTVTSKSVDLADAALGQRSNMAVVFYNTNPSALTSRRDFKLVTVPNHRDVKEALEQQQQSKKQPRCVNHVTRDFVPSSSDDEDEEGNNAAASAPGRGRGRRQRGGGGGNRGNDQQQSKGGASSTAAAAAGAEGKLGDDGSTNTNSNANDATQAAGTPRRRANDTTSAAAGKSVTTGGRLHHDDAHCECLQCTYVQDELSRFERALNPAFSRASGRGSDKSASNNGSSSSRKATNAAASLMKNNTTNKNAEERSLHFLSAAPFAQLGSGMSGGSSQQQQSSDLSLVQHLLKLQDALAWLRQLQPDVHQRLRIALVSNFPQLLDDAAQLTSARARRMSLVDFLKLMVDGPQMIPPRRRSTGDEADRFCLPQKPTYSHHLVTRSLAPPASSSSAGGGGGGDAAVPSSQISSRHPSVNPTTPISTSGGALPSKLLSADVYDLVRPWQEYFHMFDPDVNAFSDRFHLLVPILAVTSHVIPLEPEELKYDSRIFSHIACLMSALTFIIQLRRQRDGPIRLGEIFALRDFLLRELSEAKAMAVKESVSWVPGRGSEALRSGHKKRLLLEFASTAERLERFREAANHMMERMELLDAPQLVSLLQETFLL